MSRGPQMVLRSRDLLRALMAGRYDTVTLAAQVGVTKQAVSGLIRRGSCSRQTAERVAKVLGVQFETLFSPRVSKNSNSQGEEEGDVLLTIPEVGKALKISRSHAYRKVGELIAKGELKSLDVGSEGSTKTKTRISAASVEAWIKKQTGEA